MEKSWWAPMEVVSEAKVGTCPRVGETGAGTWTSLVPACALVKSYIGVFYAENGDTVIIC